MQTWSYIMLILVSIQVMMPCMDGICEQNAGVELSIATDEHDHEEESGHADHCSPFCTCSCCHSNYLSIAGQSHLTLEFPKKSIAQIDEAPPASFLDRIWNPPRA